MSEPVATVSLSDAILSANDEQRTKYQILDPLRPLLCLDGVGDHPVGIHEQRIAADILTMLRSHPLRRVLEPHARMVTRPWTTSTTVGKPHRKDTMRSWFAQVARGARQDPERRLAVGQTWALVLCEALAMSRSPSVLALALATLVTSPTLARGAPSAAEVETQFDAAIVRPRWATG